MRVPFCSPLTRRVILAILRSRAVRLAIQHAAVRS